MSSDASDAATISLFNALYVQEYANTAVSVLFMYDALITFDREVACFWESKWTGAPLLFFANKWISMTVYVMALIVQFLSFPSDKRLSYCLLKYSAMIHDVRSCSSFGIALSVMQLVQFVPWAVFSGLRAYVLSRSKLLGLFAFALSLAPVGANMTHLAYDFVGFMYLPFGCLATDNTTTALNIKLDLIARVPLIFADILLVYITCAKLSGRNALRDIRKSKRLSLSDVLFRDGVIYFIVLSILEVLHLVLSITGLGTGGYGWSYVPIFTGPITAILVSHFLLELQEANRAVIGFNLDDPLQTSRDPYDSAPSFISSLGAFINPDVPSMQQDGDEWLVGSHSNREEGDGTEGHELQIAGSSSA